MHSISMPYNKVFHSPGLLVTSLILFVLENFGKKMTPHQKKKIDNIILISLEQQDLKPISIVKIVKNNTKYMHQ